MFSLFSFKISKSHSLMQQNTFTNLRKLQKLLKKKSFFFISFCFQISSYLTFFSPLLRQMNAITVANKMVPTIETTTIHCVEIKGAGSHEYLFLNQKNTKQKCLLIRYLLVNWRNSSHVQTPWSQNPIPLQFPGQEDPDQKNNEALSAKRTQPWDSKTKPNKVRTDGVDPKIPNVCSFRDAWRRKLKRNRVIQITRKRKLFWKHGRWKPTTRSVP